MSRNRHKYSLLILTDMQRHFNGKRIIFSTNVWNNYIHLPKIKIKFDLPLECIKSLTPKCIIDLKVQCKTRKHLEENTAENLQGLVLGKEFLHMTAKADPSNRNSIIGLCQN